MTNPPVTIREAYLQASSFLQKHGIGEHERAALLLLLHVLGWDLSAYYLRWQEPFPAEIYAQWICLLERKAQGEPVQYIIGEQEFYGLPFIVNQSVLIPRPETELLVEQIIRLGMQRWPEEREDAPTVVDIGTGSGAIPITLAAKCPRWQIYSSDISLDALAVAEENARRNGVADRIRFMQGDLLQSFVTNSIDIDILVSNPPYIPSADIVALQPEVQAFEPRLALDGGEDGLDLYRRMTAQIQLLPKAPQIVGFEVGIDQAGQVRAMLAQTELWSEIVIIPDLAGIERHVIAIAPK